jgi:spermidine/putrescine transport system substrate-binding protein
MNDCASGSRTAISAAEISSACSAPPALPMACRCRFARQALAQSDVSQVRFDGWGGVVSEAFRKYAFDPYTEKTGVKVVDGTFGGGDEYLSRCGQPARRIQHRPSFRRFRLRPLRSFDLTSELNEANIPNLANTSCRR